MPAHKLLRGKTGESPTQVRYCIARYLHMFPEGSFAAATGKDPTGKEDRCLQACRQLFFVPKEVQKFFPGNKIIRRQT